MTVYNFGKGTDAKNLENIDKLLGELREEEYGERAHPVHQGDCCHENITPIEDPEYRNDDEIVIKCECPDCGQIVLEVYSFDNLEEVN